MAGSKKSNRREEILQALAQMLESAEGASRITTAKLAKQVGVSEAALYRHFPSKARMFEGLIAFIEEALMTRINRILDDEKDTLERIRMVMHLILAFSERNPGLTRILSGHALMFENERLRERINQLFERIETQLRQILRERKIREGKSFPVEERILAAQILGQVEGSLNRFVRSDFKYQPTANFDEYWALLSAQIK
ncbi:TPA: nucleoid occlusion factor SlmA [Vibrio parahaemolyticus]|uniref:nucleoid occlusion factor SlmA n=1 Tax=Vibrio parahaemolyticus TaxID=670 RepID=UPI00079FF807|nr:nucleoid occlusion factor SlmA [Vibrio parahaemolyticus]EGQ9349998.1 nucleoid occlusion factor SlmA [Vibrio parahaemolyticus]EGQ9513895.1 nucleoid occlusion factor SlmA [Vibrio parahaemolyticus]EIM7929030.1 nucleoid occlusion factor SlmA [Vibrio parahaemolyticus]EJQ8018432.1 nucleoid occlusion factor SlmA [Vibrio parahaemolyticus]EJU8975613.1 nucleoid occlusion factor SlmA [Vibrio parahaemolyticus]